MFKEVPSQPNFPQAEKDIIRFWDENKIYEKSLKQREGGKPFVFFEGPPTANGLPHPGHCLTRAIKDLFPRFKTMTGHHCLRKGGWDTHGLPVEVEVCKELGIHSKEQIEEYGVEPFNRKCLESVFRYTKEWEDLTRRLGFWVNLDEAYVTYHQSYIESVWWSLKQLFDAGLLYQGYKIVWWWAQGGTALSSGEVGQGYREVDDPSVYVRFPIVMDDRAKAAGIPEKTSLLVWTTTPWTLPSNMFAAVHNDFDYAIVYDEESGERLILAAPLVEQIAKKAKKSDKWKVERTVKGAGLVGLRYEPPLREVYYENPSTFRQQFMKAYPGVEAKFTEGQTWSTTELSRAQRDPKSDQPTWVHLEGKPTFVLWKVLHADFVTLESGTGLVHEAPAFGEVDFELWKREFTWTVGGIPLFNAVAPNGKFTEEGPKYCIGRWVKDCDKDIIRDMKERGLLLHQEQYRHDYPFCWRADEDPLIQYPRKSWFIRTTQFKNDMLDNNQHINWLPYHIKEGRFGDFLRNNVDWSLSRERYWGTPLPIWKCESCDHIEAIESYDALLNKPGVSGLEVWENAKKKDPKISEHLKIHKPYIDEITYECSECIVSSKWKEHPDPHPGRMWRVPEVIDCWYDSGAMPFAQWGFPHKNVEMFKKQFPADFISEALDQTRGWFYSLTAISVLLFGKNGTASNNPKSKIENRKSDYPQPFRNCIVLGLLMGEDGLKMSKSKKNYKEPTYIFEHEGADAMRWLFFSGQTPWTSIRFQEAAIAEAQREFLIRLYNCYSFFVIYANIDQWTPASQAASPKPQAQSELDRWITSELAQSSLKVFDALEAYDNFTAARALIDYVDALSNWYVRRSRDRFWKSEMDADKRSAYETLHHCLVTLCKLIAPFTPFIAETMHQNLVCAHDKAAPQSVHLCDYPVTTETRSKVQSSIDSKLNEEVDLVRQLVSCGRAARAASKLRVRQPLPAVELFHRKADTIRRHEDVIKDELNVKRIEYKDSAAIAEYVQYDLKPDFKKIGPKHGPLAPKVKAALAGRKDVEKLVRSLEQTGVCTIEVEGKPVELTSEEILVELHAKEGYAAERIPAQGIIVLDTKLTPELLDEGMARDLVNQIQQERKNQDLRYEQHIDLAIIADADIQRVVRAFGDYIRGETLSDSLHDKPLHDVIPSKVEIEGHPVEIYVHHL